MDEARKSPRYEEVVMCEGAQDEAGEMNASKCGPGSRPRANAVDLRQMTPAALLSIPRFAALSSEVATAGQPSEQQLGDVADAGFAVVINLGLNDPVYALDDEEGTVHALGMQYVHIPVQFPSPMDADLQRFLHAMAAAEGKKVFVHCRHNKRVPVFMALDRILRQKWDREEALQAMREVWIPDGTWQEFIDQALLRHAG